MGEALNSDRIVARPVIEGRDVELSRKGPLVIIPVPVNC